jgi:hypothetical protein
MWRLLLVTLSLLVVASACEQTAFNPGWDNGNYEIEALIAAH